jgi:RNA polymerase sigma-70 factor (ECF subfamily)
MDSAHDRFWNLLEPEHPRAELFCRRLCGSKEDGDDLYQDALLTALRRFGQLRDPSSFRPWLYRILINSYRNRNRSPWRRRKADMSDESIANLRHFDPTERHIARRWLDRAMKVLSPEDRALIVLFEIEGWSISELAQLSRRSDAAVKARLSRSRRKMRKALARYLPPNETENQTCEAKYAMPRSETSSE